MFPFKKSGDSLSDRRIFIGSGSSSESLRDHKFRSSRRGRRFTRLCRRRLFYLVFSVVVILTILLATFLFTMHSSGRIAGDTFSHKEAQKELSGDDIKGQVKKKAKRGRFLPCDVPFLPSVSHFMEPKEYINFTQFTSSFVEYEEKMSAQSRFGGHQTVEEREKSFRAINQTIHCGFVKGSEEFPSTGFDLTKEDKEYMSTCKVAVSSCIFGNSDFLRRPSKKLISDFSKKNVCFVMFIDEETLSQLSMEGNEPNDRGYIGLWKVVTVNNFPYSDMRRTGKVPKFLSHRLFPSSRYSIWLDSKLRLSADPMLILEYFLWRMGSEYAISNHYTRHCVWDEVNQNKRLKKYDDAAIDEQFQAYQADGLVKFNHSDPNIPLPSFVPEGSFIIRAHTPMSNLFSCLWFNEVDRFTSRDQLSFAYTFLKLKRTNPSKPFHMHMFKDCERRAVVKLFHHRVPKAPQVAPLV